MKYVLLSIIVILSLLLIFQKKPLPQDTKELEDYIIQKEAEIGSLSDEILRLENINSKTRIDTIYINLPSKRESVSKLPQIKRDSMFNATTDTVNLFLDESSQKVNELVNIEPYRIAAANVLFTDLGERIKIIRLQENVIDTLTQNIGIQETRFKASEDKAGALRKLNDLTEKENRKLRRKNTFHKILIPVGFIIGVLI